MTAAVQQLIRCSDGVILVRQVMVASSLPTRMIGLMGKRALNQDEGLFIPRCRAIHTWFMRVPMDAVFVNRQMTVLRVDSCIPPFRLPAPVLKAWGVLELAAGRAAQLNVKPGDRLALRLK